MKVIDLLNKIANGEEVPEKIKFKGCIYYLCKNDQSGQCYFTEKEGFGGLSLKFNTADMNDEVEVIEEDKKIEKLERFIPQRESDTYCTKYNEVANKINEIIDKLNARDDKECKNTKK